MSDDKPTLGDLAGNENFDREVEERLRAAGVEPPNAVIAKDNHETAARATGAANPKRVGLGQNVPPREAQPPYTRTGRVTGYAPPPSQFLMPQMSDGGSKFYDIMARRRAAWVGVLGAAQTAGHEVSIHLREDPAVSIARGKVVNEPALSTLDEVGIVAVATVKIERDTGAAPRRETVTVLLEDIATVTVIEVTRS
jgi:hypothetical protein